MSVLFFFDTHIHAKEGSLLVELNGHDIGRQTPPPDEDGNANINIAVPSLPPGLHNVRVSLLSQAGEPVGLSDEVEFLVDYREEGEFLATPDEDGFESCGDEPGPFCKSANDCSSHGSCHRGICICGPGFVGNHCEHEMFEDPVYFPEIDPRLSPSRCIQATQFSKGAG